MGGLSIWHILIVAVVVMLLFGRGKISDLMGDVAKGITSFRKGLKEAENEPAPPPPTLDNETGKPVKVPEEDKRPSS